METFAEHYASMMEAIRSRMPGADMELIEKAVHYADAKHQFQKRKDGSPYIIHPLAVAEIVVDLSRWRWSFSVNQGRIWNGLSTGDLSARTG